MVRNETTGKGKVHIEELEKGCREHVYKLLADIISCKEYRENYKEKIYETDNETFAKWVVSRPDLRECAVLLCKFDLLEHGTRNLSVSTANAWDMLVRQRMFTKSYVTHCALLHYGHMDNRIEWLIQNFFSHDVPDGRSSPFQRITSLSSFIGSEFLPRVASGVALHRKSRNTPHLQPISPFQVLLTLHCLLFIKEVQPNDASEKSRIFVYPGEGKKKVFCLSGNLLVNRIGELVSLVVPAFTFLSRRVGFFAASDMLAEYICISKRNGTMRALSEPGSGLSNENMRKSYEFCDEEDHSEQRILKRTPEAHAAYRKIAKLFVETIHTELCSAGFHEEYPALQKNNRKRANAVTRKKSARKKFLRPYTELLPSFVVDQGEKVPQIFIETLSKSDWKAVQPKQLEPNAEAQPVTISSCASSSSFASHEDGDIAQGGSRRVPTSQTSPKTTRSESSSRCVSPESPRRSTALFPSHQTDLFRGQSVCAGEESQDHLDRNMGTGAASWPSKLQAGIEEPDELTESRMKRRRMNKKHSSSRQTHMHNHNEVGNEAGLVQDLEKLENGGPEGFRCDGNGILHLSPTPENDVGHGKSDCATAQPHIGSEAFVSLDVSEKSSYSHERNLRMYRIANEMARIMKPICSLGRLVNPSSPIGTATDIKRICGCVSLLLLRGPTKEGKSDSDEMINLMQIAEQVMRPGGKGILYCAFQHAEAFRGALQQYISDIHVGTDKQNAQAEQYAGQTNPRATCGSSNRYGSHHERQWNIERNVRNIGNGISQSVGADVGQNCTYPQRQSTMLQMGAIGSTNAIVNPFKVDNEFKDARLLQFDRNVMLGAPANVCEYGDAEVAIHFSKYSEHDTKNIIDCLLSRTNTNISPETAETEVQNMDSTLSSNYKYTGMPVRAYEADVLERKKLISYFTSDGDCIADLTTGAAATAIACLQMDGVRPFVGYLSDDTSYRAALISVTAAFARLSLDNTKSQERFERLEMLETVADVTSLQSLSRNFLRLTKEVGIFALDGFTSIDPDQVEIEKTEALRRLWIAKRNQCNSMIPESGKPSAALWKTFPLYQALPRHILITACTACGIDWFIRDGCDKAVEYWNASLRRHFNAIPLATLLCSDATAYGVYITDFPQEGKSEYRSLRAARKFSQGEIVGSIYGTIAYGPVPPIPHTEIDEYGQGHFNVTSSRFETSAYRIGSFLPDQDGLPYNVYIISAPYSVFAYMEHFFGARSARRNAPDAAESSCDGEVPNCQLVYNTTHGYYAKPPTTPYNRAELLRYDLLQVRTTMDIETHEPLTLAPVPKRTDLQSTNFKKINMD